MPFCYQRGLYRDSRVAPDAEKAPADLSWHAKRSTKRVEWKFLCLLKFNFHRFVFVKHWKSSIIFLFFVTIHNAFRCNKLDPLSEPLHPGYVCNGKIECQNGIDERYCDDIRFTCDVIQPSGFFDQVGFVCKTYWLLRVNICYKNNRLWNRLYKHFGLLAHPQGFCLTERFNVVYHKTRCLCLPAFMILCKDCILLQSLIIISIYQLFDRGITCFNKNVKSIFLFYDDSFWASPECFLRKKSRRA